MSSTRRKKWRIYQLLVASGLVKSKAEAAHLAHSRKITVNGVVNESLHYQVHPFKDEVRVNGKVIKLTDNRQYFVLDKPTGVETTKEIIIGFIKDKVDQKDLNSFTPVGRLDKDTTGLLIITNDGRLVRRVLDPKTKRAKVYHAHVDGLVTEDEIQRLRNGVRIELDEGPYTTMPAQVQALKSSARGSVIEVILIEGKKRQVRKMCAAIGHDVRELRRVAIAKLTVADMHGKKVVEFSKEELYKKLFE